MNSSLLTIAIIDDDASVRVALQRLCQLLGLSTQIFGSGADFFESLDAGAKCADCILLDAHMPEMTGLELLHQLKGRGVQVPTFLLTGDDMSEVSRHYVGSGVTSCLSKPVSARDILGAVERIRACSPTKR
jgi:FixJ family two-component response regulator